MSLLKRLAYNRGSCSDQWKFTVESLKAQGVNDALGGIQGLIDGAKPESMKGRN